MTTAFLVLFTLASLGGATTITGSVMTGDATPAAGATVYLETGATDPLRRTTADGQGRFAFDAAPPGRVWVFAEAPGWAWGGAAVDAGVADSAATAVVTLRRPGAVSGRVTGMQGDPVSGATVERVALLDDGPVSIPFAKLGAAPPRSGDDGRFTVERLPKGGTVALKLSHPSFAQEGVADVAVGTTGLKLTLSPGVIVEGQVLSRGERIPVANTGVLIRNAQPPHDTVTTKTNARGTFLTRVKPGMYVYRAVGAELRSPGWNELAVTGAQPRVEVTLYVAGTARVRGEVRDALTKAPVPGARLVLSAHGNPSERAVTGADGAYRLDAAEGENAVRLESAPGYRMPDKPVLTVHAAADRPVDLPTFWLMPQPTYRVTVLGEDGAPAGKAALTMLRPRQVGWWLTGPGGGADLRFSAAPADGAVVGVAESATTPAGAAFAMRENAARVMLLPYGEVRGTVRDNEGDPVEGAVVAGVFSDAPGGEPLTLWRTVSGPGGEFTWPYTPAGLRLACVATTGASPGGTSRTVTIASGGVHDVGNVIVADAEQGASLLGEKLRWPRFAHVAGPTPEASGPRTLVFADASEAPAVIEALGHLAANLGVPLRVAVCVTGNHEGAARVPVLRAERPGTAGTYTLDGEDRVTLESFGLPPLAVLTGDGADAR